jgi:hypothetical protein
MKSSYIGTLIGLIIGSLLFTFICRWYLEVKFVKFAIKRIANAIATKYLLATIIFFSAIFGSSLIYDLIYNIWTEAELPDKIALLRVVSNVALSAAIGGTTTYIAYQQYRLARIKSRYEDSEFINKTFYRTKANNSQLGKTSNLIMLKTKNYYHVTFYNHKN